MTLALEIGGRIEKFQAYKTNKRCGIGRCNDAIRGNDKTAKGRFSLKNVRF